MTADSGVGEISAPKTLDEAMADMARGAVPVAGATWIMRAPLRHEALPRVLMSLRGLTETQGLSVGPTLARIGAMTTHAALATALEPHADLAGIAAAAGASANPGIRNIATIGGNIAAAGFPASDLAPALLAVDARVVLLDAGGERSLPMASYLAARGSAGDRALILRLDIPRSSRRAVHERLPMRKAGDYPCAILDLSADVADGMVRDIRIAVGAVEAAARRWTSLEGKLAGTGLDPAAAEMAAAAMVHDFAARDAIDAPGWYRLSVLPVLLRRAISKLQAGV